MKKLKLLTSLGAISALGGGIALATTSCSKDKDTVDNGKIEFKNIEEWEDYVLTGNYIDDYTKEIDGSSPTEIKAFAKEHIKAGNLANGLAILFGGSLDTTAENTKTGSFDWSTSKDKIEVSASINGKFSVSLNSNSEQVEMTLKLKVSCSKQFDSFTTHYEATPKGSTKEFADGDFEEFASMDARSSGSTTYCYLLVLKDEETALNEITPFNIIPLSAFDYPNIILKPQE